VRDSAYTPETVLRDLEEGSSIAEKNGYSDLGIQVEHLDT
jgi:hypothetical protein